MNKKPHNQPPPPRMAAATDLLAWYLTGKIKYRQRRELAKSHDYSLYRNLVSTVVRYREKYLFYIRTLTSRPLKKLDPEVVVCLMLGLAQLDRFSGIHEYAAVNETVNLISLLKKPRLKGFINGNLRSFQRQKEALDTAFNKQPLFIRSSHPEWMVLRWQAEFGINRAEEICQANNRQPEVKVVVNPAFDRKAIEADLGEQHEIIAQHSDGFTLKNPTGLFDTRWAESGAFLVQDASSQQINSLIRNLPKEKVLDACSSPGGKLFHLEWEFGSEVEILVALEISAERLGRLTSNRDTFKSRAKIVCMDAAQPGFSTPFNLILVDAPCSATGTIQKHPELKWQRRLSDIRHNQTKQLKILDGIKNCVAADGHILYITCSMEKEENQDVVQLFLENNPATFKAVPFSKDDAGLGSITTEGYFQCDPQEKAMGLFAALLQKTM